MMVRLRVGKGCRESLELERVIVSVLNEPFAWNVIFVLIVYGIFQ